MELPILMLLTELGTPLLQTMDMLHPYMDMPLLLPMDMILPTMVDTLDSTGSPMLLARGLLRLSSLPTPVHASAVKGAVTLSSQPSIPGWMDSVMFGQI